MNLCAVCNAPITEESPAILTMGGFGHPRHLCADCAARLDTVTEGRDAEAIEAAMERISADLASSGTDDEATFGAVKEILDTAARRVAKIKEGTYDFSEDDAEKEGELDEIPEELLETEEDRALDREEEEKNQKFDRALNWVWVGVGVVFVVLLVLWLVRR